MRKEKGQKEMRKQVRSAMMEDSVFLARLLISVDGSGADVYSANEKILYKEKKYLSLIT